MGRGLAAVSLALVLGNAGCDSVGSVEASTHACPPGACCTGCCEVPATGTDAGKLPPRPKAPAATGSSPTVFAISKMYFGDTDRAGHASDTAWTAYGLDIDGKVTSACSTNTCTLAPFASTQAQVDGDDGIDNSFGANLLPIIVFGNSMYSTDANQQIQKGSSTLLVNLDGLGSSASYSLLPGATYRAMPATQAPKWNGTDVRNVDAVSLVGGDISKPIALMANGYMNDRVWVGGVASGTAYLDLQLTAGNGSGFLPPVPIHHLQVAMQVASGNASATSGVLSGVARTEDVVAWVALWAGAISTSLCTGSAFQSLATQMEQTSDIMADGSNEPGEQCDGISVGLGFDAVQVHLGKSEAAPPVVNPCEDGGVDAPTDGG